MRCSLSGAEVSRYSKPLFPAAAPLSVAGMRQDHDTRLLPAGAAPGALPGATESTVLVGISGSGKRRFVCPDYMRRTREGRIKGMV